MRPLHSRPVAAAHVSSSRLPSLSQLKAFTGHHEGHKASRRHGGMGPKDHVNLMQDKAQDKHGFQKLWSAGSLCLSAPMNAT